MDGPEEGILKLLATVALLAVACGPSGGGFDPGTLSGAALLVERDSLAVKTGTVGMGDKQRSATYVLVDVKNPLSVDAEVELGGKLVDASGAPIGVLYPESLRIPAEGMRSFALVHHGGEVTAARSADVRVTAAQIAMHAPVLAISEGHVWRDEGVDRVIVTGYVNNRADRDARVVVVAGFYDEEGRLMKRPFTTLMVPGEDKKSARFVGPLGSRRAYLFVASAAF